MAQRYEFFFKTTQLNPFFYSGSQNSVRCSCERSKKNKKHRLGYAESVL